MSQNPLVGRAALRRFAVVFGAALIVTGFTAGSSRLTADLAPRSAYKSVISRGTVGGGDFLPGRGIVPGRVTVEDTVVVFVVWGASNMGNQGTPGVAPEPPRADLEGLRDLTGDALAYEWSYWHPSNHHAAVRVLRDAVPTRGDDGTGTDAGSIWHALDSTYFVNTGHTVFMSSANKGSTGPEWQPEWSGADARYGDGVETVQEAFYKAKAYFDQDSNGDTLVVFGGIIWNLSPGLAEAYSNLDDELEDPEHSLEDYPWPLYRAELDTLLATVGEDVFDDPSGDFASGRFYFINTVVPGTEPFDDYGSVGSTVQQKLDADLDLEADLCAAYEFCSMIQVSGNIKLQQLDCLSGSGHRDCGGWYVPLHNVGHGVEDVHWGQGGLNVIGEAVGGVTAAHGFLDGVQHPYTYEVAVEVPLPGDWCHPDDLPCGTGEVVPEVHLDVYGDAGTAVSFASITPSIANPDWTADFDGDYAAADWSVSWASLSTEFLTFEFYEVAASDSTLLARYAYVPGEIAYGAGTGFFRPLDDADAAAAYFEVWADTLAASPGPGRVRARSGPIAGQGGAGPFFEEAFAAGDDTTSYVMPYDHDYYEAACTALSCPDAAPDFFLARLPVDEDRPDSDERRFTFADEADVSVPSAWGALTWDVDGLVLTFPAGIHLVVENDLAVTEATLTEAKEDEGWGGVVVYEPGSLAFDGVTVTAAEVGIEVNADGNTFDDLLLDGNGVGILTGYACGKAGCGGLPSRSGFALNESCVVNSVYDPLQTGYDGHGIWGRHTDAAVTSSTVEGNGGHGLFLDDADLSAYRLLLDSNGGATSPGSYGAHLTSGGDLTLASLSVDPSGENLLESNAETELFVDDGAYATVGIGSGSAPRNDLERGSLSSGYIVSNYPSNATLPAMQTYWGTGTYPPAGSINGPVNTALPLSTSPSGSAGYPGDTPGDCADAGANGGSSLVGGGLVGASARTGRGGLRYLASVASPEGTLGGTPQGNEPEGGIDPEAAAWFRARLDSLRLVLAEHGDDAGAVRALYATQRLDRTDALGERAETMGLLGQIRGRLLGGGPLTSAERAAGEAALVAAVHDALRAGGFTEAHALLAPFDRGGDPLPEIEGDGARHTLALALAALDEASGDLPSALARIEAVVAELGPEDDALARDLQATIALLTRRMDAGGAGAQGDGPEAQTHAGDLPTDYALGHPYPNPFTGETAVPFALPEDARVTVTVYDVLGRRVAVLADGMYEAGRHVATLDGRGLAAGLYVVRAVMERPAGVGAPGARGTTRSFTRRITLVR